MNMQMVQPSQEVLFHMVHQLKILLHLFWHHLNMNLGEYELSISRRVGEKHIDGFDNHEIFLKTTIKQPFHRILYATCELSPPFYFNYYSIHARSEIIEIIRQLEINYPNKIKGYHSNNNETCILSNTQDYTSNVTSTPSWLKQRIEPSISQSEHQMIQKDLCRYTLIHNRFLFNSY